MFTKIKLIVPSNNSGQTPPRYSRNPQPQQFDSISKAKTYLASEIDRYVKESTSKRHPKLMDAEEALHEFLLAKATECNVHIGDYVFWIIKE